ncbi:MAG: heme-binding protein [Opitutae bacterium]|jgi:effector-binding domain-containing protein|nr:heme-binding protein [Opitutae bacterium]MDG1301923.1 heme-binding protein [Opitutae bacterium]
MKLLQLTILALLLLQPMSAYESAFARTNVGTIEIKTIPAARLLASQSDKSYFESDNGLFRPLFRYIQANDIAMTTPVEAAIAPGTMYFYVGSDYADLELKNTDEVTILELPERTVLSLGVRGGYSAKNFNRAQAQLLTHLSEQNEWLATGPARAIYWNSPFMPGIFKRSEVHIPVEPAE